MGLNFSSVGYISSESYVNYFGTIFVRSDYYDIMLLFIVLSAVVLLVYNIVKR
jgi:hypothetical protein